MSSHLFSREMPLHQLIIFVGMTAKPCESAAKSLIMNGSVAVNDVVERDANKPFNFLKVNKIRVCKSVKLFNIPG